MEYASPEALLDDVQLTLENDARWYRWCTNKARGDLEDVEPVHWRNAMRYFYYPAANLNTAQRNFLRKYFKWRYYTDQKEAPPEMPGAATITVTIVPTPPQEKPVMASKLAFRPVFLLNGVDITKLPKEEIYTTIAVEEQRLEELRKIKHQPKSLVAEIEAGETALQALVDHLDAT